MHLSNKIRSINEGDRVLEVGPGGKPHPRADLFLELDFEGDDKEALAQRAFQKNLQTEKEVVYYTGRDFPFSDKEFDYVICSHVLEHIEDVGKFLSEMFRVSRKGYLEYPTIYYDYIFKIPEHLNLLLYKNGKINWMKHEDVFGATYDRIREFYYRSLFNNYWIKDYKTLFFQGYEWETPIQNQRVNTLKEITYEPEELDKILPPKKEDIHRLYHVIYNQEAKGAKMMLRKLHYKLGEFLK